MSVLFEPVQIGDLQLANRVIMAPLTRSRGTGADNRVPNDLIATYYSQRANAGLIISEATAVTPMGVGYARTPGIWSDEQVQGWKKTTSAVHAKGGKIVLQLWHVGRISDPIFLDGQLPVAPSAIAPSGHVSLVRPEKAYVTPRALETSEIPGIVEAFRKGAENAKAAGFDGVEIHGANGYLIDQFLQDSTNHRTDEYGGSIENRARLALEITDAVISVWGAGRVGYHIAPRGDSHSIGDSDPVAVFTYLASELGKRKIAFICAREYAGEDFIGDKIKAAFGGAYIVNEKFTQESAEALIEKGDATAVAFGSNFISNPDLLARLQQKLPLAGVNWETVYGATAVGYTDYPVAG
jgi:2,4-dienoyl-CoA reductase-like NADH-dependent reductase (Old Yellow Enzyme family)